jgi:hypothetical protein
VHPAARTATLAAEAASSVRREKRVPAGEEVADIATILAADTLRGRM